GPALDQDLENARLSAAEGVRMPRFMYDKSVDEVKKLLDGAPFTKGKDVALFADGKAKIKALQDGGKITPDEAKQMTADLAKAMTETMKPAYDRLVAWLNE